MRLIIEVKNPTEELTAHILFHSSRGIFRLRSIWRKIPYPRQRRRSPIVFASNAKQSPGRVGFRKAYTFSLKSWDISLALNMTCFLFYVILNDSEESHRIIDGHILLTQVVGYFACAQYDVLFYPLSARGSKATISRLKALKKIDIIDKNYRYSRRPQVYFRRRLFAKKLFKNFY